jgi:hypothetical protein
MSPMTAYYFSCFFSLHSTVNENKTKSCFFDTKNCLKIFSSEKKAKKAKNSSQKPYTAYRVFEGVFCSLRGRLTAFFSLENVYTCYD